MNLEPCPLCVSVETALFDTNRRKNLERDYLRCTACDLIFVPKEFHISPADQKDRYLQHNNDPDDPKYREFLSRLLNELKPYLSVGSIGLDYGAGPGPALAIMMRKAGFEIETYDPFFQPDRSVLSEKYHFVTCTETVEHFEVPRREFETLNSILSPGGWLGVMTSMLKDRSRFSDWYYQRDPTHVAFYSEVTIRWIADAFGWDVSLPRENVVLFRKP